MQIIIILLGALILGMGVLLLAQPRQILDWLVDRSDTAWLYAAAIIVRLLLGAVLIRYAPLSRFPLALEILGWVALVAAVGLLLMGRGRFSRLVRWAFGLLGGLVRIAGVFAVLFGAFLIYAVV
jgi:hypothetical protein